VFATRNQELRDLLTRENKVGSRNAAKNGWALLRPARHDSRRVTTASGRPWQHHSLYESLGYEPQAASIDVQRRAPVTIEVEIRRGS
jgi:hypothetical protein